MIIVPKGSIQGVASAITDALMSASTHTGGQFIPPTIDPQKLMDVALGAITMIAGDVCWPAGKRITVHVDDRLPWVEKTYERR
jgi:hypothetical protein